MQVTREDKSKTNVDLKISVDQSTLQKHHRQTVQKLADSVKVPGFRAGKAPLDMIEKQLDQQRLQNEVIDAVIQETANKAVTDENLRFISQPNVNVDKYVPNQTLDFTLSLEVLPPIKLPDYKKIKKSKPQVAITPKDITQVLENLRERSAERKEVKRAAQNGDEIVINFNGFDQQDNPIAGGKGNNYPLKLGSDSFIPGFEAGLIGKKAGEHVTLNLTFPKSYNVESLSGKKARFEVDIDKVQEMALPKLDDKFAAKIGPFKSLDDLKKDIKDQLKTQKTDEAINKLKDEIVEEIVKKTDFELPQTLVNDQMNDIEQQMRQDMTYRGVTLREYLNQEGLTEEKWREEKLKPEAQRRVRVGVVIAEIANAEKVSVSDQELSVRTNIMKQQYPNPEMAGQLDQPAAQREIANRLVTEKTVDLLYNFATK
jgi:trigger factor